MGSAAAVARLVEGGDNRDERCDAEHRRARRARRRAHHPSRPPALRRARHRPPADGTVALLLSKLLDGLHAWKPSSPSAAAAATPGRALGRPQTEEAGCGWSELRAELRAELRSARLAPRPQSSHPRSGAPWSGRGTPCDSWGSGRSRPRSRRCATPGSPRRPGTRPTRRRPAVGATLVAASGHHRDRRGRGSRCFGTTTATWWVQRLPFGPDARSVQPSLRRHVGASAPKSSGPVMLTPVSRHAESARAFRGGVKGVCEPRRRRRARRGRAWWTIAATPTPPESRSHQRASAHRHLLPSTRARAEFSLSCWPRYPPAWSAAPTPAVPAAPAPPT